MSTVVSDASPVIVLAKAELLTVLSELLPQAVVDEILAGPEDDPMRRALPNCSWLKIVAIEPAISPLSTWQMGRGEAEVIEYARLHGPMPVLLDDRTGRRAATTIGLKVYGTLSVVAMAVKRGRIQSFASAVSKLKTSGLYVGDDIIEAVRKTLA
jgi:uncharacterized protein